MIKKIFIALLLSFFLTANVFSAGSTDSGSSKTKTYYDKAVSIINSAKKFEKKGKEKKAIKNYEKAQKLLIKSNVEVPNKADTLNYLEFRLMEKNGCS